MVGFAALVGYAVVACMLLDAAFGTEGVFWFMVAELAAVGSKFLVLWYRHYKLIYRDFLLLTDREY